MIEDKKSYEQEFQKFLVNNAVIASGKNVVVVDNEYPLYSLKTLLSFDYNSLYPNVRKEVIGKIDVVFRYGGIIYIAEIKGNISRCFWYSTKVLAYRKWYLYQNSNNIIIKHQTTRPAIIIPKKVVTFENRMIANMLGITVFCFIRDKFGKFEMDLIK